MNSKTSIVLNVFGVIIFSLLIVNFLRIMTGYGSLTFESLLNYLQNAPSFDFYSIVSNYSITTDWGLFNFLRDFFNMFISLFNVIVFLAKNVLNLINYIIYFIRLVFVL